MTPMALAAGLTAALLVLSGAQPACALPRTPLAARVANFAASAHPPERTGPEMLSFWKTGRERWVEYRPQADGQPVRLDDLGPIPGGFALRFPDGQVADVRPVAGGLQVRARSGQGARTFVWAYEGPVDGRGTACLPCVPRAQALDFVRDNFMQ